MKTLKHTTLALIGAVGLFARAVAQEAPATAAAAETPTTAAAAQPAPAEPTSAEVLKMLQELKEQNQKLTQELEQLRQQRTPSIDQIMSAARDPGGRGQSFGGRGGRSRGGRDSGLAEGTLLMPELTAMPDMLEDTNANIRLNFRGAPMEQVLSYLSEAAGYVIVYEARPNGTVDLFSEKPVTKKVALEALSAAVWRNGYVVGVNGNLLTLRSSGSRTPWDIPILQVGKTNFVPPSAQQVTAIIPVSYVNASEVLQNIYSLGMLPNSAAMTANQSGNSLLLMDSMYTVHRVVNMVRALDNPVASGQKQEIIFLNYADPVTMAGIVQTLYSSQGRNFGGGNNPLQGLLNLNRGFGGGGFGGGGFGGGGFGGGGGGRGGGGRGGGGRGGGGFGF